MISFLTFPFSVLRKPLNRNLKINEGEKAFYVALWYQHGNPLIGRCWEDNGKIAAAFTE